jgi:hypothetical protein
MKNFTKNGTIAQTNFGSGDNIKNGWGVKEFADSINKHFKTFDEVDHVNALFHALLWKKNIGEDQLKMFIFYTENKLTLGTLINSVENARVITFLALLFGS